MTIRVEIHGENAQVGVERIGYVGFIIYRKGQYVFSYYSNDWERLRFAENAEIQEAVKKPIVILTAIKRLKGK